MKITSPSININNQIDKKYTCDGENINPPLRFSELPANTKSLVLIMDDPDAPNGTWVHWIIWNISPEIKEIAENSLPLGSIQGKTSSRNSYNGPCPPKGTHRYFFKLYALDTVLDINDQTDAKKLLSIIDKHIIEQTELVGLYQRK